jgi:hypothetical protein
MSQLVLQIPTLPDTDRGQCGELDPETMKRCDGRMVSDVRKTCPALVGFPVWTCSACGKVVVP